MAFAATLSSSPIFFPNIKNSRLSPNAPLPNLKFSSRTKTLALPEASAAGAVAASFDGTAIAVLGGGSIAALAAILSLSDLEKCRRLQAEEVGGDDKQVVKDYFNNSGFQRWKKIYGDTDDVNRVQLDIRIGHAKTVENALKILKEDRPLCGVSVCDTGCGTGSLSIPLAREGAIVSASDISAAMVSGSDAAAGCARPPPHLRCQESHFRHFHRPPPCQTDPPGCCRQHGAGCLLRRIVFQVARRGNDVNDDGAFNSRRRKHRRRASDAGVLRELAGAGWHMPRRRTSRRRRRKRLRTRPSAGNEKSLADDRTV